MASPRQNTSTLITIGRAFFGLALLGFGTQYALYRHLSGGLPPVPPWVSHGHVIAYAMAAFLILMGLALVAGWQVSATSVLVGVVVLVASCLHLTHLHAVLTDGGARTGFLEPLSFAAAAFFLHGLASGNTGGPIAVFGRVLYGASMIIFGAQHFMYTKFIEALVPAWIGHQYFWVVFTGIVLIVTGLAIMAGTMMTPAGFGLAAMFFGWLVTLHIPLCIAQPRSGDLWASLFVVVGLTGTSLLFAAAPDGSPSSRRFASH
jgi:hypothetical protein